MTPVPLTFWYDDPEAALRAAKAAGKRRGCRFNGYVFPEGRGFEVWREGVLVERHIVRKV